MESTAKFQAGGPLDGIKILDLSAVLSGPIATALLADQGANVTKVESFHGDIIRHLIDSETSITPPFVTLNRGKKAIAVDLKKTAGVELVKKIAATSDVFVQNFRPGAIERMGLGYDVIKEINPKIIYCSISGFGPTGPYAHKRVYDPLIQGLSGLADIQRDDAGRPKMMRTVIPDKTTGLTAAQAITAALYSRSNTGKGQHIQVAMLDAVVSFIWAEGMAGFTRVGDEDKTPPLLAPDRTFKTVDGYITVGVVSDSEWEGLCIALGKKAWLTDKRFNTPAKRVASRYEQINLIAGIVSAKTSAYWLDIFDKNNVPSAPVLTRKELLTHEQIVENELIKEFDHPGIGRVRQARPAARFSETPAGIHGFAPFLGEHSRDILIAHGYTKSQVDKLFHDEVVQ